MHMQDGDLSAMVKRCEETSRTLKLLAHPQRLQMLCHLSGGEKSVGQLERLCGASQSRISQFLARMRGEGLVACRRDGSFVLYRIHDERVRKLIAALREVFCP
jgi:ArsR family transcriptional regulator, virulence genes transcriptional regulator